MKERKRVVSLVDLSAILLVRVQLQYWRSRGEFGSKGNFGVAFTVSEESCFGIEREKESVRRDKTRSLIINSHSIFAVSFLLLALHNSEKETLGGGLRAVKSVFLRTQWVQNALLMLGRSV